MRVPINAVDFDAVTMDQAVARIVRMVEKSDHACHVCTGNLDHLALLQTDGAFRAAYESADLVLADGAPVVWLSRLGRHGRLPERVAGSDLFWELARASSVTGMRLFFLGGAPGAAGKAADAVRARYAGAQICGTYCPPFETFDTAEEQARIMQTIRDAAPDVLLVGLGAPKQEKWIIANKNRIGVPVSIGVGGSFEMAAGVTRRAPRWMQRAGLEWSYRLLQEPKRLWQRYLLRDLPCFLRLVVAANRAPRSGRAAAAGARSVAP